MPRKIDLEKASNQEITLTGLDNILQKVEVSSSDPSSLQVTQVQKSNGQLHYRTKLLDSENHVDLYVLVNSPMTHQNVQIPIVNERFEKKCSLPGLDASDWSIFGIIKEFGKLIAFSILMCTLIFRKYYFYMQLKNK